MWDDTPWSAGPPSPADQDVVPAYENGWPALILWCLGPERIYRRPRLAIAGTTVTERRFVDGSVVRTTAPRTEPMQRELDDDIDSYLADADVPPRPRDFDWFFRLPPGLTSAEDFWAAVNRGLARDPSASTHPRDLLRVLPAILDALYEPS